MTEDTNIDEIKDEILRRIYHLQRFREFPMDSDDENQILDILKLMTERIIRIEEYHGW